MHEWTHKHRLQQYWSSPPQGYAPRGCLRTLARAPSMTSVLLSQIDSASLQRDLSTVDAMALRSLRSAVGWARSLG